MTESSLPPLYSRWVEEFLRSPLPDEPRSTCFDCAMLKRDGQHSCVKDTVFHPDTKCCTYFPELPNFLVGGILEDKSADSAAGHEQFEKAAIAKALINPLGVFPTLQYGAFYRISFKSFGQAPHLRCPYYMVEQGGLCGIWRHRNARCSTWFCKHERGSLDVVFWRYVDKLLSAMEKELAMWCITQLDIGAKALQLLIPAAGDPSQDYNAVWGNWLGKEREFFANCSRMIAALSWNEALTLSGAGARVLAGLLENSFRELQTVGIPKALRNNSWASELASPGFYRIWAFSPYDPIDLPLATVDALVYFDGRPTSDALRSIESEKGIRIEPALLQKLCDMRVLVSAE